MSNLIKSGFVAFSQNEALVINANENKIIKALDSSVEEYAASEESTAEEALAEAMIRDAELEGMDFDEDVLTMDTAELPNLSDAGDLSMVSGEVLSSAKKEAEEIVSHAHDEAEQLRAAAYDEAESIRQQAKEEGYQSGYEEGIAQAQQELSHQQTALLEEQSRLEESFVEKENQLIQETEHRMVDLLCQLIPSITGVVIDGQRDVLLYMINNAMQELDNSKHFVIKVSSYDYEEVAGRKEEIYGAANPNIDMEIFEDAKLSAMQCLIETDNGIVDVSLDVQLDNLLKAIRLLAKE